MIRRLRSGVVLLPLAACNATAVDLASQKDPSEGANWEILELGGEMVVVPSEPNRDNDNGDVTEVDDADDGDEADDSDNGDEKEAAREPEPYELQWVYQWDSAHSDDVIDLALDGQGGVVAALHSASIVSNLQPEEVSSHTLMKLDASGHVVWSAPHEDATDVAAPERVAVAPNGDIYGVGVSGGDPSDLRLTRFDAQGAPQWDYEWGSAGTDTPTAIAVDSAGKVLVAGHAQGALSGPTEGDTGAFVALFDDAGEIAWQRQLGAEDVTVTTIAFSANGDMVVGTVQNLPAGGIDSMIRGFDSSGDLIWLHDWVTPNVGFGAMALDEAGAIFVGGGVRDGSGFAKPLLAKLDSQGEVALFDLWEGDGWTWVQGVAALADGGIALATTSRPGGASADWSGIVIVDADGNRMEPLRLDADGSTWIKHLEVDSTDALFVAGNTEAALAGTPAVFTDAFVAKFTRGE